MINRVLYWTTNRREKMSRKKIKTYKPTGKLQDYKEAIQIIFVDYADIWMSGKAKKYYKEIDKKLRKLGI